MNFTELCELFAQHGSDRMVIAKLLHMTPEQIDEWQRVAMKIANELKPDSILPSMSGG